MTAIHQIISTVSRPDILANGTFIVDVANGGATIHFYDDGGTRSAAYSSDGMMVATVVEHFLNVFDAETDTLIWQYEIPARSADFAWSPDGTKIAYGMDRDFQIIDAPTND